MEKKSLFIISVLTCVIFLLVALLFTPGLAADKKPIKLKLSNGYPARHPMAVKGFGGWAKMVEEKTNNRREDLPVSRKHPYKNQGGL